MVAADFYHSNVLMGQSDADIVARVQRNVETCEPGFLGAKVTWATPCSDTPNPVLTAYWSPSWSVHGREGIEPWTLSCNTCDGRSVDAGGSGLDRGNAFTAMPALEQRSVPCAPSSDCTVAEHAASALLCRWWTARCCGSRKP